MRTTSMNQRRTSVHALFLALATLLAACAAAPPPAPDAVLPRGQQSELERETAPYRAGGTAVLVVQVKLETPRGPVIAGEGTPVVLLPATTWTSATFERDVVEGDRMPEQAVGELVWRATTDADGRCTFRGLAPGAYLVASPVAWRLGGEATYERTDVAYARISIAAGQQASVTATRTSDATELMYFK
jgi:hypothetical protein